MILLQVTDIVNKTSEAAFGISPGTVFGVLVGFMFTVIVALAWYIIHRDKKTESRELANSAVVMKLTEVVSELKEEISKQNAVSSLLAQILEDVRKG